MVLSSPSQATPASDFYAPLRASRLFACLTNRQTRDLVRVSSIRQLPDRASLRAPSQTPKEVQFLLSGRAKVCYRTSDGREPILYFVNADELVGEQAILSGRPSEEFVETIEPTLVANIPLQAMRQLMLGEPVFATGISELISRRRTRVERRIKHLLFLSNRERLTHLLLDLAEEYGIGPAHRLDLQVKLSHQDMANFIGSTRETVTVVLGQMQSDGLLNVRRRRIMLLDTEGLAKSVNRGISMHRCLRASSAAPVR